MKTGLLYRKWGWQPGRFFCCITGEGSFAQKRARQYKFFFETGRKLASSAERLPFGNRFFFHRAVKNAALFFYADNS